MFRGVLSRIGVFRPENGALSYQFGSKNPEATRVDDKHDKGKVIYYLDHPGQRFAIA